MTTNFSSGSPRALRTAASVAVVAGAVGSIASMLLVGQRNPSALLLVLFAGWVAGPFLGLAWANTKAVNWSRRAQINVHALTLLIAFASLAVYGNAVVSPAKTRGAFVFLMVPVASWVLAAIVAGVTAFLARRSDR